MEKHTEELLEQRPVLEVNPGLAQSALGPTLGRAPLKYNQLVHETIVNELKRGQRPQGACARAHISLSTFHEWVKRGKSGDPWLAQFAEDVEIAYNEAEANAVDVIHEVMQDEDANTKLKAASYWLERARSDGYSKQVKQVVENQIRDFMMRLEAALEPHIFEKVLAVYLGQGAAPELPAHTENGDDA